MQALILSDIHGNQPALAAALDAVPDVDAVFCLGDIVHFGPDPAGCVDLIRQRAGQVVRGNHDEEIVRLFHALPGALPPVADGAKWSHWTAAQLSRDQVDYLAGLPEEIALDLDGHRVLLRHDLPLPGPLIMPDAAESLVASRLDARSFDVMFVGHVHMPYQREIGDRKLVDVGSIGQPEHADGCASYVLWKDGVITFHKVKYDVEKTISQLRELPLSCPYVDMWGEFWRHGYVDREALGALEAKTREGNAD